MKAYDLWGDGDAVRMIGHQGRYPLHIRIYFLQRMGARKIKRGSALSLLGYEFLRLL